MLLEGGNLFALTCRIGRRSQLFHAGEQDDRRYVVEDSAYRSVSLGLERPLHDHELLARTDDLKARPFCNPGKPTRITETRLLSPILTSLSANNDVSGHRDEVATFRTV